MSGAPVTPVLASSFGGVLRPLRPFWTSSFREVLRPVTPLSSGFILRGSLNMLWKVA
jgi:hypothetical protein